MNSIWSLIKQNRERQEEENKTKDRTPKNSDIDFLPIPTMSEIREEKKAQEKEEITVSISPPWISQTEHFRLREIQPLERLHEEILDLVDWLQLDPIDQALRETVYQDVSDVVHKEWPDAVLYCFGSYATGLSLPSSDIDIMIKGLDSTSGLHQVANLIRINGLCAYMEKITHARIPIIKFKHKKTGLMVDVCFNQESSLTSTIFIQDQLKLYPFMKPMILFFKYILDQRGMNETYQGGVGSFCIAMMVLAFLQYEIREDQQGGLLSQKILRFLYFYGYTLNSDTIGLSVMNGGSFFNKEDHDFYDEKRSFLLSIENPFDNELDVGKGSYRYNIVKVCFIHIYRTLMYNLHMNSKSSSLLENVVQFSSRLPQFSDYPTIPFSALKVYTDEEFINSHHYHDIGLIVTPQPSEEPSASAPKSNKRPFIAISDLKANLQANSSDASNQKLLSTKKSNKKKAKKAKDRTVSLEQVDEQPPIVVPDSDLDNESMEMDSNILLNNNDYYNDEYEASELIKRIAEEERQQEQLRNSIDLTNVQPKNSKKQKKAMKKAMNRTVTRDIQNVQKTTKKKKSKSSKQKVVVPHHYQEVDRNFNKMKEQGMLSIRRPY